MSAVALLFPGQGAKNVHASLRALSVTMGPQAAPNPSALRALCREQDGASLCELAAAQAGVSLERLLRLPSLLDRTEVVQPVLTALSLVVALRLRAAGVEPRVVLGHSLGEVAAWSAAGGVAPEDAVRLAALRGRLMAAEASKRPGGMVALATADASRVEAALAAGRLAGELCVAGRNAPDETVLSGDEAAIRAALAAAPDIATRVPTAGAWHSPAMAGALEEWRAALHAAPRSALRCAFVANRHGDAISNGDKVPDLLAEQLVRPVELAGAFATVSAAASAIVTIGPGAVLRALWRKNIPATREGGALPEAGASRDPAELRSAPSLHPKILFATDTDRALSQTISALTGRS